MQRSAKLFLESKRSIVIIDHINVNCNHEFINLTFKVFNDGINSSVIGVTVDLFADVARTMMKLKVNIPQDENDKNYGREVLHTSIDLAKLFNGVQAKFLAKIMMEILLCAIDFELKFPFKRVRFNEIISTKILQNSNVHYRELTDYQNPQ